MFLLDKTIYLGGPVLEEEIKALKKIKLPEITVVVIDDHFDLNLYNEVRELFPAPIQIFSDFFFDPVCNEDIKPFPAWISYKNFTGASELTFSHDMTVDCFNFIGNKGGTGEVL